MLLPDPAVVELPKKLSHVRFGPYCVAFQLLHHKGEPGAAGPPGPQYPDDVRRIYTMLLVTVDALRKPRSQLPELLALSVNALPLPGYLLLGLLQLLGLVPPATDAMQLPRAIRLGSGRRVAR